MWSLDVGYLGFFVQAVRSLNNLRFCIPSIESDVLNFMFLVWDLLIFCCFECKIFQVLHSVCKVSEFFECVCLQGWVWCIWSLSSGFVVLKCFGDLCSTVWVWGTWGFVFRALGSELIEGLCSKVWVWGICRVLSQDVKSLKSLRICVSKFRSEIIWGSVFSVQGVLNI